MSEKAEVSDSKWAIYCQDLDKAYDDGGFTVNVLKGLSLAVSPGEMLAIIGASGSGKSTLLHLLGGLDTPTSGKVVVAGQDLSQLSEKEKGRLRNYSLGFIYQFHHLLPEFSALENVAMPLLIRGLKPSAAIEQAASFIDKIGLGDRQQHRVGELSGGERQRIAIARALVTQPHCVLADEPTGNLDNKTAEKTLLLMRRLNEEMNSSFVIATHNETMARQLDRVLILKNGQLYP